MVELGPRLFSTPAFWLAVICLAPIMALLLDFALSASARQAVPLDRQIFQVWTSLLNFHLGLCVLSAAVALLTPCTLALMLLQREYCLQELEQAHKVENVPIDLEGIASSQEEEDRYVLYT